jgi:HEAT repeat protein
MPDRNPHFAGKSRFAATAFAGFTSVVALAAAVPSVANGALFHPALASAAGWSAAAEDATPRSGAYREGQRALSDERWSDALAIFAKIADGGGDDADAAAYWKAWTESKLGRRSDALTTIRGLVKGYPQSAWVDDAKALEIELRGSKGGSTVKPEDDEDLKLYALDGLMQVDPARAVPILERFLAADHSLKLKERALFVLAQSDTPRARQILLDIVRRGDPPTLRLKAVEQLGVAGDADDLAALSSIWKDGTPEVKAKVLEAWMIANHVEPVFEIAKTEADPRLRQKAIELLGVMGATRQLTALYGIEKDVRVRGRLLEAYGVAGDVEALERAYRSESEPSLRGKAIEGIGVFGGDRGAKILVDLYGRESDPSLKRKAIEALFVNGAASELVGLFRKERDPELKRKIVQNLSLMDDDEAQKVLSDILGGDQ